MTIRSLGLLCPLLLLSATAPGTETAAPTAAPVVAGTVTGKVVFDGDPPEPKPLQISAETAKGCHEGDAVDDTDMSLLVGKDGGIANVVVTISIDGMAPKVPEKPKALDQKGCRFSPHVVVVPVGGTVAYLNSDGVSHNIHTYAAKNAGMNQMVAPAADLSQKFEKAEEIKVTCDVHPWMTSYIVVTDASKYTVSGRDGKFSIEGLEPGDYKVEFWHETLGKGKADVTVAADGSSEMMEVKMGAKKKKGGGRRR